MNDSALFDSLVDTTSSDDVDIDYDAIFDRIPPADVGQNHTDPWDDDPVCSEAFSLLGEALEYGVYLIPASKTFSPLVEWSKISTCKTLADVWGLYVAHSKAKGYLAKASTVRSLALVCGPTSDHTVIVELDNPNWKDRLADIIKDTLRLDPLDILAYKSRNKKLPHLCFRVSGGYDVEQLRQKAEILAGHSVSIPRIAEYAKDDGSFGEGLSCRANNSLAFCYRWDDDGNQLLQHNQNFNIYDPPEIDYETQFLPMIVALSDLDESPTPSPLARYVDGQPCIVRTDQEQKVFDSINADPEPLLSLCDGCDVLTLIDSGSNDRYTYWRYQRIGSENRQAVSVAVADGQSIMFIYSADSSLKALHGYGYPCSGHPEFSFVKPAYVINRDQYGGNYSAMMIGEADRLGIPFDPHDGLVDAIPLKTISESKPSDDGHLFDINRPIDISRIYQTAPPLIRELTELLCAFNPLMPDVAAFATAYVLAGGIIAKRATGYNMGRVYHPSEWLAILQRTGANKSAIVRLDETIATQSAMSTMSNPLPPTFRTLADSFTAAGLHAMLGKSIPQKDYKSYTESERINREQMLIGLCKETPGFICISDELSLNLTSLISSMSGSTHSEGVQNFLKLADNDSKLTDITDKHGYRMIYNPCLALIGMSQPDTWDDCFSNKQYQTSGFIGRFSIIKPERFKPLGITRYSIKQEDALARIGNAIGDIDRMLNSKLVYDFNQPNYISSAIDRAIEISPYLKAFRDNNTAEWDDWRGKIIISAIKKAMIWQALSGSDALPSVDAMARLIEFGGLMFFTYVFSKPAFSEYEQIMVRIYQLLQAKGSTVLIRDIQQRNYKLNNRSLQSFDIKRMLADIAEYGAADLNTTENGDIRSARWNGNPLQLENRMTSNDPE